MLHCGDDAPDIVHGVTIGGAGAAEDWPSEDGAPEDFAVAGWFSVSTAARFTSILNYLASVPSCFCDVVLSISKYVCGFNFSLPQGILDVLMSVFMTPSFCGFLGIVD